MPAQNEHPISFLVVVSNSVLVLSCIVLTNSSFSPLSGKIYIGFDNGTISSVIQSTNQSRVPSSRPRADVRLKGKDTRSNAEHKVERKR